MQTELPILGLLKSPDPVREDILRTFGDEEEAATKFAIRWAWDHRRVKMNQRAGAQYISMPSSHFSNMLNGDKHLPPFKINAFEWICGNRAVSMTIERFREIREQEQTKQLALLVAGVIVRGDVRQAMGMAA